MPAEALYVVATGRCWFCGIAGAPVVYSQAVAEDAPPGICESCARDAVALLESGARPRPAGCVCDPGEWTGEITPPSGAFDPSTDSPGAICATCEHDQACHEGSGG